MELAKIEETIREGEKEQEADKEKEIQEVKVDAHDGEEKGKEKDEKADKTEITPQRDDTQIRNFFGLDASEQILESTFCLINTSASLILFHPL